MAQDPFAGWKLVQLGKKEYYLQATFKIWQSKPEPRYLKMTTISAGLSCITLETRAPSFIFLKPMLISFVLSIIPGSSHHNNVQNVVMHYHNLAYVPRIRWHYLRIEKYSYSSPCRILYIASFIMKMCSINPILRYMHSYKVKDISNLPLK